MGTRNSRWWTPKLIFACFFAASLALAGAGPALATGPDQATRKQGQANWEADLRRYQEIEQWIKEHGKSRPEVPVPPKLSWPCKACGEGAEGPSQSETAANEFVDKASEPERGMARDLLRIKRDVELAGNDPAIPPALRGLTFEGAKWLRDRVLHGKADPMARKYGTVPEMAYAGIKFVLVAKRAREELGTDAYEGTSMAELANWVKRIEDRIDTDIYEGHQYNLCPNYLAISREIRLLGEESGVNLAELEQTVRKMDDFLHFDLEMDWESEAEDTSGGGGVIRIRWRAKGLFHLKMEIAHACFTPELVPEQQVQVDLLEYVMKDKQVAAKYEGPWHYGVPVQSLKLTLCDQRPQLALQFADFSPKGAMLVIREAPPQAETVINALFQVLTAYQFAKRFQGPEGQQAIQDLTRMATGAGASGGVNPVGINGVKVPWTNGTARPVDATLEMNEGDTKIRLKVSLVQHPKGAGAGAK